MPAQATVNKPPPNAGYTDFEYGMITNPATQASALTVCPGCAVTYGGAQVYSGVQTGNYLEAGAGVLNIIGGAGRLLPKPLSGSGPAPGMIEVSDRVKSVNSFTKTLSSTARDFAFDPKTNTFVIASTDFKGGHTALVRAIGASDEIAVGGRIKLNEAGMIETSQWSGHYGSNWTKEVATQFRDYMRKMIGRDIDHTGTQYFRNGTNK